MAVVSLAILTIAMIALATTPAVPDFSSYQEGKERKTVFFSYFQPLIDDHNQSINRLRLRLETWYQHRKDLSWLADSQVKKIAREYGISAFDVEKESHWLILLRRVDIVPTSLALAQAAMESAWGTSRFARNVNNYFGQWCFSKDCGMVPVNRDPGAKHEVRGFSSPEEAVVSYVHNLNSHHAYKPFRKIRAQLRSEGKPITGIILASGLMHYSERGQEYVKDLRSFIRQNKLSQYDNTGD